MAEGRGQILYFYNELNELTQEDNQILNKTVMYYYDEGGNLTRKLEIPYDGGEQTNYYYEYSDTNWKDKLTSYNGKGIEYDSIGNPLSYDGWSFSWNKGRQLESISGNDYDSIGFKYNSSGIRTEKKVTINGTPVTTSYHLSGNKVTYETNGSDKIYYTYDSNGKLVSMNLNGEEYYYIRNAQGDIIGLFDKDGITVVSYTYDSWGKPFITDAEKDDIKDTIKDGITGSMADTIGVKNPYRYRGYRYDSEAGLTIYNQDIITQSGVGLLMLMLL